MWARHSEALLLSPIPTRCRYSSEHTSTPSTCLHAALQAVEQKLLTCQRGCSGPPGSGSLPAQQRRRWRLDHCRRRPPPGCRGACGQSPVYLHVHHACASLTAIPPAGNSTCYPTQRTIQGRPVLQGRHLQGHRVAELTAGPCDRWAGSAARAPARRHRGSCGGAGPPPSPPAPPPPRWVSPWPRVPQERRR